MLNLYMFDEGLFLYEAKRIWSGEVMYRDFFEMVTPRSFYWMAVLFGIFGVTLETARVSMAVLHALIAVLIYLVCREIRVRRPMAVTAAALQAVLFYPALTIASPHWVSTFPTLVLLYLLLRAKATRVGRSALLGTLAGLLVWTQQQKGWAIAVAVALVLMLDWWRDRRASASPRSPLIATLAAYAGGVLAISVPIVIALCSRRPASMWSTMPWCSSRCSATADITRASRGGWARGRRNSSGW